MTFSINGFDLTPYIANKGLKWQRSDVDGPNAGRDLTGDLIRDRRAIKIRFDVTCIPVTGAQLSSILTAIEPESYTLTYSDPTTNTVKTGRFYSNNFPVNFGVIKRDGTEYWAGLTFPVIQF